MNKHILRICFVIITLLLLFGLNCFREENNNDRKTINFIISRDEIVECVIDINQMNFIKKYLQPNVFTIYLRGSTKSEAKNLSFIIKDLTAEVSQGSKKGDWSKIESGDILKKNRKNIVLLNLEIVIPYHKLDTYDVQNGVIQIVQEESVLTEIHIKIINSKYSSRNK